MNYPKTMSKRLLISICRKYGVNYYFMPISRIFVVFDSQSISTRQVAEETLDSMTEKQIEELVFKVAASGVMG